MQLMNELDDTSEWDKHRHVLIGRKGGWVIGEGVRCHGYDLLNDLVGELSYFQLIVLNALGYIPERRFADWLESAYMCLSWPDPRIWCNRVGALAGSVGGTVAGGTAAGILAGDSEMYGAYSMIKGAKFIQHARQSVQNGVSIADFVEQEIAKTNGKVKLMGFARPIAKGDERIPVMEKVTLKLGYKTGGHLETAYRIQSYLSEKYGESMNVGGYFCAFFADQGLSGEDVYKISSCMVASGVTSSVIEEYSKKPESFLPLMCDDLLYNGPARRAFPE
jgi:citrate synthase